MKRLRLCLVFAVIMLVAILGVGCNDGNEIYTIHYTYGTACSIKVRTGEMYEIAEIPEKDGYAFIGLYDAEDGGTKYIDANGKSVRPFSDGKDITLYVRFIIREYKFEFCYDEGVLSDDGAKIATYGNSVDDFPILTVGEHRVFNGWYTAVQNGEAVADCNGKVADNYRIFDYAKYEQGENFTVKLYASVGYELVTVKFYNELDGVKTLLDERKIEYGTNITKAAFGIKSGNLSVTAWSSGNESIFIGAITQESEFFAKSLGMTVDLSNDSAKTVQIAGNNTSVLLYGDEGESYPNVNIAIGGNTDDEVIILLYNAHIIGNSANGTISSSNNRAINLYSLGESNEIDTSLCNTSAVSIEGELHLYGNANLTVRGGNGVDATVQGRAGSDGSAAISVNRFIIDLKDEASLICYGGSGGNGKNGADAEGKSTGAHSPDPGGDGGNGGSGGCGISANSVQINSGEIKLYGGNGGDGGSGGKGQDSSHNDRNPAGQGGRGGSGGNGGVGLECGELCIVQAVVSNYGGNGGSGANGGNGGNASDNDWYDKTDYGGSGGNGGRGGNGGDGIVCGNIDEDSYYSATGGNYGTGGRGGNGGSGYGYGSNGSNGGDGRMGEATGSV